MGQRPQTIPSMAKLLCQLRWTMKTHSSNEDDGRWQVTWAALFLNLIQHSPPPSDEESESCITNNYHIRGMIANCYC